MPQAAAEMVYVQTKNFSKRDPGKQEGDLFD
jgi:hypothetical protein